MIKVYSKDYCPYCKRAIALLDSLDVKYEVVDITQTPEVIEELAEKSGFRTVPQIYVGDKCLGGFTDIDAMHQKGELIPALKGE